MGNDIKVPIPMYHNITSAKSPPDEITTADRIYAIDETDFQKQMEYLRHSGYYSISLEELIKAQEDGRNFPHKPVVITFDDGYVSNYTVACPIIQKYGFKAVFFVTVSSVGSAGMLSWWQIRNMLDDGMEIGSHTLTHPYPSELSDDELRYELAESKRILEANLQREARFLSSPTGYHNKAMGRIAREVGYKALCINILGGNVVNSDPFSLRRVAIKRGCSVSAFGSLIELRPKTIFRLRVSQLARDLLRKCLGVRTYEPIRRRIIAILKS